MSTVATVLTEKLEPRESQVPMENREPLEKVVKLEPLDPRGSQETPVKTLRSPREHPVTMARTDLLVLMDYREFKEIRVLMALLVMTETMVTMV